MYLYYTTYERNLDEVLALGLPVQNDCHPQMKQQISFWLSPVLGAEVVTKPDWLLFKYLHPGMFPMVDETGKQIFAFPDAVTVKLRVRQDQVRDWRYSDIKNATVQRLLGKKFAADGHHFGGEWHVVDHSILPNQIMGVSSWNKDFCGSRKVLTTRYLARVPTPQTSLEIGSDSKAA